MRLWTISPKYLDTKGLVALWRETLLAKNVLLGNTKGYKNHPQLLRFKDKSLDYINNYLKNIYLEAKTRGYNFDKSKFEDTQIEEKINVTLGQIKYEFEWLKTKLKLRDIKKYGELKNIENIEINDIFEIIEGEIESWEKYKKFSF